MKIVLKNEITYICSNFFDSIIYIECNGVCYPSEDWDDMAENILGCWANDLLGIRILKHANIECPFFDGPYRLRIHKSNNLLDIDYMDNNRVVMSETIEYRDFLKELLCATERLCAMIDASPDREKLGGESHINAMHNGIRNLNRAIQTL